MINQSKTNYVDMIKSVKASLLESDKAETVLTNMGAVVAEYYGSKETLEETKAQFQADAILPIINKRHAVGCKECREGYKGRIGLYELLHTTPQLRHLIRQQSAASEYMKSGVADGMLTLKQDGIEKVMAGITDMVQVHRACI